MDQIRNMLETYTGRELTALHMPGHKRKPVFGGMWDEIFQLDVTEVPGTDDLHHAAGPILESQKEAAGIFGAAYSHYLVGGSTAGILAAIRAAVTLWEEDQTGQTENLTSDMQENADSQELHRPVFLVAANCHKSVWNGLRLTGADPVVLTPEEDPDYGPVKTDTLLRVMREEVEDPDLIAGCILTSPTYGGAISPLGELHAVLEVYGIPLIVDEAHGAHLPFCPELEWCSGVQSGAEYVIQSLHKTLPAMTQTAILHVGRGDRAWEYEEVIREQLAVFQSSSPSYILMLSAEQAVGWADRNRDRFGEYLDRMKALRMELTDGLKQLSLIRLPEVQDPTRLLLRLKDQKGLKDGERNKAKEPDLSTGTGLAEWLERERGIVAELAGGDELILLSSVCDDREDLDKLKEALFALDTEIKKDRERKKRSARRKAKKEAERAEKAAKAAEEARSKDEDTRDYGGAFTVDFDSLLEDDEEKSAEDTMDTGSAGGEHFRLPAIGEFVQRDIYVYPPGVPILRGGQRVTAEALERLKKEQQAGRRIYGL